MNALKRILLIIEDAHLALALQIVLSEHGNVVLWENDARSATKVIREFQPDVMLTASPSAVFISRRNSAEIAEFPRPADIRQVRQFAESLFGD